MRSYYKVIITESDYQYTIYTTWVSATSKVQAVAKGAALAGQEKTRREFERTGRPGDLLPCGLMEPVITVEKASLSEYWDHRDEVTAS